MEPRYAQIPEHSHDWPVLSLYVLGEVTRQFSDRVVHCDGPSVVLHPANEPHANCIGYTGLEQIDIQFDPSWLPAGWSVGELSQVSCWQGGQISAEASRLVRRWTEPGTQEGVLASETAAFLGRAVRSRSVRTPAWFNEAKRQLDPLNSPTTIEIARDLNLHPSWFAQAYRMIAGEGVRETLRRKRVELAIRLLKGTSEPIAEIAVAAGFYDQSHMIRCFRSLLGRTPVQVRTGVQNSLTPLE